MMNMLILLGKCILVFQRKDKLPFCSDEQKPFLFNSHFNFVFINTNYNSLPVVILAQGKRNFLNIFEKI